MLESYPRDELFQVDDDTLFRFAIDIMNLSERPRIRALARADEFDRFISVLVFIPKDRYDTTIRRRVGEYLAGIYQGRVSAAYPSYPDGPLARTHYIIGRNEGATPHVDRETLESGISDIVRTWADGLRMSLEVQKPASTHARSMPAMGKRFQPRIAKPFHPQKRLAISKYWSVCRNKTRLPGPLSPRARARYARQPAAVLARRSIAAVAAGAPAGKPRLPGRQRTNLPHRPGRRGGSRTRLAARHDAGTRHRRGDRYRHDPQAGRGNLAGAVQQRRGLRRLQPPGAGSRTAVARCRHDPHARALPAADPGALRPGLPRCHAGTACPIAARIVALFRARFDPRADATFRAGHEEKIRADIEEMLGGVSSLDDDRILRRFVNLVEAAVRSNFFQIGPDGAPRPTITVKFICAHVEALPLPRPMFEIFVYCPRVEGLHLRFGKVARGGLRWSDRPQDYRTEVLGLVKAQQVKNAVIVPVGAKGGFVPSYLPPPSDRQAWMAEGTESYRIFVRSLLELTDNIIDEQVAPPANTVRHDPDDPYLVVAADKGTATFSDVANAISIEEGYWLGDAFASGGSQGYDHKQMAITARGAWEAVKRHFREMDIDIQRQSVRVAGVGDMSGDVFGNGALQSRAMSWWRHSTTAISSSIPSPTPNLRGSNASACSTCRDRVGRIMTAIKSPGAVAFFRAP